MSRLVTPLERSTRDVHRAYQRPDEYLDRVAKYIPAEVVGGYVSLDGILASDSVRPVAAALLSFSGTAWAQTTTPEPAPVTPAPEAVSADLGVFVSAFTSSAGGIIFLICLVLAPLYVWVLARRAGTTVWKAQAFIAALAFLVWAYAIKGSVFFSNKALDAWTLAAFKVPQFYDPQVGAALLVLFSMVVAFYQPKAD